jgi:hypothetical protein
MPKGRNNLKSKIHWLKIHYQRKKGRNNLFACLGKFMQKYQNPKSNDAKIH